MLKESSGKTKDSVCLSSTNKTFPIFNIKASIKRGVIHSKIKQMKEQWGNKSGVISCLYSSEKRQ